MEVKNQTETTLTDEEILAKLNMSPTGAPFSDSERREHLETILRQDSEEISQKIVKEMMQKCIAIGQESHQSNLYCYNHSNYTYYKLKPDSTVVDSGLVCSRNDRK